MDEREFYYNVYPKIKLVSAIIDLVKNFIDLIYKIII